MQLIITDAWLAKSRALHLSGWHLLVATLLASLALMLFAAGLYHWVFLKGAREGWPVIGSVVKLIVKDENEQRDRYLRENLDVMARRVGEMQARMMQLESLGERVSGLAGVNADLKTPRPCLTTTSTGLWQRYGPDTGLMKAARVRFRKPLSPSWRVRILKVPSGLPYRLEVTVTP